MKKIFVLLMFFSAVYPLFGSSLLVDSVFAWGKPMEQGCKVSLIGGYDLSSQFQQEW